MTPKLVIQIDTEVLYLCWRHSIVINCASFSVGYIKSAVCSPSIDACIASEDIYIKYSFSQLSPVVSLEAFLSLCKLTWLHQE